HGPARHGRAARRRRRPRRPPAAGQPSARRRRPTLGGSRSCLDETTETRSAGGDQVAVEEIHAEMVSSVWKVLVEPGTPVAAGDTPVIPEQFKRAHPAL